MALNNLGLGFVFTARDLASGAIGNLERNFMSLDRRVGLGTADEATQALQDLAAAGYNVTESISLLNPVLDLAAGSLGQLTPSRPRRRWTRCP